jgi:hypothetical protein
MSFLSKEEKARMKEQLLNRIKDSQDYSGGSGGAKYFKPDIELPLWKAGTTKEDPHIIDVIPFMAGANVPRLEKQNVREGDWVYHIRVFVHQNIGPGKIMVLCPAKNYGKKCPICEEFEERQRHGEEWDEISHLSPSQRCIYNIVVMDGYVNKAGERIQGRQEKKGVQIWEVSYKYSEKIIKELTKNPRGGGIPIDFTDPEDGKSVQFSVLDDKYKTNQGHKFIERDYTISEEILKSTYVLDEILNLLSYEEISSIYSGEEHSEQEETEKQEDEKPRRTESRKTEKKKEDECPFGGQWAVDCDQLEECLKQCPEEIYKKCGQECDRLQEEKRKQEEEKPKRGFRKR